VIGRKNWIFAATPKGASASANLYSLIETAKTNGLEPGAYIVHKAITKLVHFILDNLARLGFKKIAYQDKI
jgi:hypothetical protein